MRSCTAAALQAARAPKTFSFFFNDTPTTEIYTLSLPDALPIYTALDAAYSYSPLQVYEFTNGELASIDGSNPLINLRGLGGYIKDLSRMGTVNVNLRWDIPWVKGLNAYVRGTFDDNHRIEKRYSTPVTLYTYDATTEEFAIDQNTVYPKAKTTLEQTDRFYKSQLYEAGINYNNTFAAKPDVRCGSHELIQLLCCDQRAAPESVPDV